MSMPSLDRDNSSARSSTSCPRRLPPRTEHLHETHTVGLFLLAGLAFAYEVFQGPTELIYRNTNQTANGYTLFGVRGTTYLTDMEGHRIC